MFINGGGGWTYFDDVEAIGGVYARLDSEGRVVELYLHNNGGEITTAAVRRLPLHRLRAIAQSFRHQRPDLAAFAQDWPVPDVLTEVKRAFPPTWIKEKPPSANDVVLTPQSPAAGITDDFLRTVASAYGAAVARGERPNKALAAQSNSPQRTVERWVYLARKGGFLAPTQQGRIG